MDEERYSLDSPEAREAYAEYQRATPAERRRVIHGEECEHPDQDEGECLECGEFVMPTDLWDLREK